MRVFETIAPQLVKVAPDAVILIVTDPPEPLIDVTRRLVGRDRVIGTSTYLDSLRFRVRLAERFAVSPACVEANVGWRARHFERIPLVVGTDRRDGRRRRAGEARERL
jgi:malate/lactate dehydrogenase